MKTAPIISVAPMMDCTDRHYRRLMRCISQKSTLYTEMLTAGAVVHGDRQHLLRFNDEEHPLVFQLGGSDPALLAKAAKIVEDWGYDEINLNVGCPSARVQSGSFGACLMKEPALVTDCMNAMRDACDLPVSVKTRLGVDEYDSYDFLCRFIDTVSKSTSHFVLHARKAWLKGLSPKQNRDVPPLMYERVYQIKQDYPELHIGINGGIKTLEQAALHLEHVDEVMIGREAYAHPYVFATVDHDFYGLNTPVVPVEQVVMRYLPYIESEQAQGTRLRTLIRPLIGLFQGVPGARSWRRYLSEHGGDDALGTAVVTSALGMLNQALI
jgi:tRNA-dihydrouridine synthase A